MIGRPLSEAELSEGREGRSVPWVRAPDGKVVVGSHLVPLACFFLLSSISLGLSGAKVFAKWKRVARIQVGRGSTMMDVKCACRVEDRAVAVGRSVGRSSFGVQSASRSGGVTRCGRGWLGLDTLLGSRPPLPALLGH